MSDETPTAPPEHVKAELAKLMAKLKALPPLERAPQPLSRRLPEVAIDPAVRRHVEGR